MYIYSYKVKNEIKYKSRWQKLGPRLTKELKAVPQGKYFQSYGVVFWGKEFILKPFIYNYFDFSITIFYSQ